MDLTTNTVLSQSAYTYYMDGNTHTETDVLANATTTYTYDARDRQSSYVKGSTLASYTYYPTGLRKSKLAGGVNTHFIWDGGNMICEYTASATAGKVYVYGLTLISQEDSLYYIYNAHGDVVKYISGTGALLKTYEYDAFGEEINASATDSNPFRYAGQYFDSETGTYYLRARYYSPGLGRFTQQDAWGYGDPTDPLSLNLYVYCYGNPVRYYDPSGNSAKDIIVGIGLALDDSLSDGTAQWIARLLIGKNRSYAYDSAYDYYLGRVIGDILAVAIGAGQSIMGIMKIVKAISSGAAITIGSGGTAALGGVAISVSGVAVGALELSYGATVIVMAASNLGDDFQYLQEIKNNPRYILGRPDGGNPREDRLIRQDKRKIKSDEFLDFLRANGENPSKWTKVMETWEQPDGTQYERHYWTNGKKSYYHE